MALKKNFDDVYDKIVAISDRHFGVGSDGVIFLLPSDKADIRMRMFNNDASEGEMCGNGIRCLARWAYELGLVKKKRFSVETGAGILYPEILEDGNVRVDMGRPHLLADEIPVTGYGKGPVIAQPLISEANGKTYTVTCVSMGNPHCVIFVDDIKDVDLTGEGPHLEADAHFPKKRIRNLQSSLASTISVCACGKEVQGSPWPAAPAPVRLSSQRS